MHNKEHCEALYNFVEQKNQNPENRDPGITQTEIPGLEYWPGLTSLLLFIYITCNSAQPPQNLNVMSPTTFAIRLRLQLAIPQEHKWETTHKMTSTLII